MWSFSSKKSIHIQLIEPVIFVGSYMETCPVVRGIVHISLFKHLYFEQLALQFKGTLTAQHQVIQLISQQLTFCPSQAIYVDKDHLQFIFEMPLPATLPESVDHSELTVSYELIAHLDQFNVKIDQKQEEIKKIQVNLARLPESGMLCGENYPSSIDSLKHTSPWCQYRIMVDKTSAALGSTLPVQLVIASTVNELKIKQVFAQLIQTVRVGTHESQSVHFLHPVQDWVLPHKSIQQWHGNSVYQIPFSVSHSTKAYAQFGVHHALLVSVILACDHHQQKTVSYQTSIDLIDSQLSHVCTKLPSYNSPISTFEKEKLKCLAVLY
ncbi:uncharacterized protein B0P05DRAFT_584707 [Gilbertella persicaria]|uniref:uncharacterized protein n=1 Tax=Gilbertella persicaria TaxID=101096 RepID=UPI00221F46F8|nr:uncharacterized protein B0P05DRAFT_584707 [Gilbertella persicaria]KAI8087997.1 hypothetical protein B0P05DRAFT_584707 [Gilbertella persicaria]